MPESDPRRFRKQAKESVNRELRRLAREETWPRSGSGLRNPSKKDAGNHASVKLFPRMNSPTPIAYGRLAEDNSRSSFACRAFLALGPRDIIQLVLCRPIFGFEGQIVEIRFVAVILISRSRYRDRNAVVINLNRLIRRFEQSCRHNAKSPCFPQADDG